MVYTMTTNRCSTLAEEAVAALERDGYAVIDGLVDGATMAALTEELAPDFETLGAVFANASLPSRST